MKTSELCGYVCLVAGLSVSCTAVPDAHSAPEDAGAAVDSGSDAGHAAPTLHYQSTASVGDFIQITLDKQAHTISYVNRTNGLQASDVAYTVGDDGVYSFAADPNHHLQRAIELSGVAFIMDVDHAGPNKDTRALAIGALAQPITLDDLNDRTMNMMQFRTNNGGMEVGNVHLSIADARFSVGLQSYWPLGGLHQNDSPFHIQGGPSDLPVDQVMGGTDYLTVTEMENGQVDHAYVFKTSTGFAIDMSNGNIIMAAQPATKAFDPSWAGDYEALIYDKHNARGTSQGQTEPGTADVLGVHIHINASGHLTVTHDGNMVEDVDLVAVADAPYLTGDGKLDPARCNGLFTFRTAAPSGFQDVFVIFSDHGLLLSSFSPSGSNDQSYQYFYGAAVKP